MSGSFIRLGLMAVSVEAFPGPLLSVLYECDAESECPDHYNDGHYHQHNRPEPAQVGRFRRIHVIPRGGLKFGGRIDLRPIHVGLRLRPLVVGLVEAHGRDVVVV